MKKTARRRYVIRDKGASKIKNLAYGNLAYGIAAVSVPSPAASKQVACGLRQKKNAALIIFGSRLFL